MIGNDVVDLCDPESSAAEHHARFDGRVFDATERELIAASPQSERVRWAMWAAKESAYKAARQQDPRTVFSPRRFAVRFESQERASVSVGERRFRVALVLDDEHVHAVAGCVGDRAVCAAVAPHHGVAPSAAARQLAIATLAPVMGVAPDDLAIQRDGRIPRLWLRGRRSLAALSLSHHGRFVAFACALPRHWSGQ